MSTSSVTALEIVRQSFISHAAAGNLEGLISALHFLLFEGNGGEDSVLSTCIRRQHDRMVRFLLDMHPPIVCEALSAAIQESAAEDLLSHVLRSPSLRKHMQTRNWLSHALLLLAKDGRASFASVHALLELEGVALSHKSDNVLAFFEQFFSSTRGKPINFSLQDAKGHTALMALTAKRDLTLVQLILNEKANVTVVNEHNDSALTIALKNNDIVAFKVLLDHCESSEQILTAHPTLQQQASTMSDKRFSNYLSSFLSTHHSARGMPSQQLPTKRFHSSLSSEDEIERRDKRACIEGASVSGSDDVSELESESDSDELHSLDDDEEEVHEKGATIPSPSSISDQRVCDAGNIQLIVSLPNMRLEDFDFPFEDRTNNIASAAQTQTERDRERQQQRTKEIEKEIARATAAQQQRRMQQKKQAALSPQRLQAQRQREGRESPVIKLIAVHKERMEDDDDDSERVIFAFPKVKERKRPNQHAQNQQAKEKEKEKEKDKKEEPVQEAQAQGQEQAQPKQVHEQNEEQSEHDKGEQGSEEMIVASQEGEQEGNALEEDGLVSVQSDSLPQSPKSNTATTASSPNALHAAAEKNDVDALRALLESERGHLVDEENADGFTALMTACSEGHLESAQFLISMNANVRHCDRRGDTPLSCASCAGSVDIVKLLVGKGALIDSADLDGETSLMNAADNGHIEVVRLLLESKANVNAVNNKKGSGLMWACTSGHGDVAQLLINSRANVFQEDENDATALMYAIDNGHIDVVRILEAVGAFREARVKVFRSRLYALARDNEEMSKYVLRVCRRYFDRR